MRLDNLNSSSQEMLKYIALLLMTIDHTGAILYGHYEGVHLSTILGRLVFPIFAYLAIYNYLYHTKDKKRYIARLFVFAIIAQVPYFFAFYDIHDRFTLNVLFTLGFGLWYIYLIEEHISKSERNLDRFMNGFIISFVFLVLMGVWGDFSIFGILTLIGFYLYLKNPSAAILITLGTLILLLNIELSIYAGLAGVISLFVIYLFNHTSMGVKRMLPGIGFYLYYPLHLFVLLLP